MPAADLLSHPLAMLLGMNGGAADRTIEQIARRQHGVFSRAQALDRGLTPRMIQVRRASGAWLTLAPGVYALPSHAFDWLRQVKAAELSIPRAVVSHASAAALHGLSGTRPGRIELSVPPATQHQSRLATVHRVASIERVVHDGIAVTPVARTIVDISARLDAWHLGRTIDDALLGGLTSLDELAGAMTTVAPGRPRGLATLRSALAERADGHVPPDSELEARLLAVLDDGRLPPVERQARLPWWPSAPQRVDVLLRPWRRIVEADGRRWHTRVADFDRDRARDHLAQRHGYEVTRFTYRQVVTERSYVIDTLLAIGAQMTGRAS